LGRRIFLGNFYPNLCFLAITFEPETFESQSKALKDLDYSLVSTKKMSSLVSTKRKKTLPLVVGAQGLTTSANKA